MAGMENQDFIGEGANCLMLSFKTRQSSREGIGEEGICQGLVIADEQKQQLGILPESIYTVHDGYP